MNFTQCNIDNESIVNLVRSREVIIVLDCEDSAIHVSKLELKVTFKYKISLRT
ncbi:hypothetical protein HanRHA438_Chr09g0399841 [Helianthus annuus]|nr:hypothetical protein HanRHA438_Chr09g0399841 [Helianthus annuus]